MALYNNKNTASPVASVEFAPVVEGNFSFFSVNKPEEKEAVKQWLKTEIGQKIISDTVVGGKPMLVGHGAKKPDEILKIMTERGDALVFEPPPRKAMDTWKVISMFAVPGQMMQLASAFMKPKKPGQSNLNWGLLIFSASSLLGHAIGWTYGSQKTDDEHRLDYSKRHFNQKMASYVPDGLQLPYIQEDRSSLRDEPTGPKTSLQKANDFMRKNSVTFGELFLRYFGAFALAFPTNKWKSGFSKLNNGKFKAAFHEAKNPSTLLVTTGLMSILGKSIALFSKAPDPYDPKPKTWMDKIREKYIFNIGGNIEAVAFGIMAYEGATNPQNKILWREKPVQNYLSAFGAAMFSTRYVIRNWAKYGEKEFDMEELRAHVTDSLAIMPHGKLPQLIGDTAADLTDHFKDKKLRFGEVYMGLRGEMQRYHSYHSYYGNSPNRPPQDKSPAR